MERLNYIRNYLAKYYSYFFLPLILVYLFFNIFDGNNGLLSHARLDLEITSLESKIDTIKKNNDLYEIKIASIQSIDHNGDIIDEQIRNVLGYGKSNEFIVFFDN